MPKQSVYKEKLGFNPSEGYENGIRDGCHTGADFKTFGGYEESLSKFKDERDAIQKKTFTKWVNKHLKKAGRQVRDLFEDVRDGHNLISLLEVLSGEHLPRDRGKLRFHMLHNVQVVLDFLRFKKIKLVNIRCEDIVDGNPKLTLGLIWTIILHFQISDIVVSSDNLSAKEALLKWARRTTHRYPDVRVNNFTTSWRDGLAMVAIIHRNRPDLVDWRHLRQRSPRDRLETAFHVMEKEYAVTRLLDPEDVDTPEPDEKSLITYISQLYEIFPNPPSIHPLFNIEAQKKLEEYRELATSLLVWIRENIGTMRDRRFPSNPVELKRAAQESSRFRLEEVPPRLRDKSRCQSMWKDIHRHLDGTGILEDIPHELHYPRVDSEWNKLMSLFQERDDALQEHVSGSDKLNRLADKINRDIRHTERTLEETEIRIEEETRRIDRLHPLEAKKNCDAIDNELNICEDTIRNLHSDVKVLRDNKHNEAPSLHKRVSKLDERYVSVRNLFENRLLIVLNNKSFVQQESYTTTKRIIVSESRLVDSNEHFKFLQECINWCKDKLRRLNDSDYGNDLPAVEREYENHQKEHKIIHQFHTNVDQCSAAENNFSGEERRTYVDLLSQLRKTYAELLSLSNKRVSDLFSLLEFLQAATQELIWLNEKEDTELNRDWANKGLNIPDVERYHEKLMNELEKRESQFSSVQDRGNSLVLGHHPASKTVEAYLAAMQTQWQWLLELTLCLETHLHHASHYHTFFTDIAKAEQWIMAQDERLNTTYSVTDFGLDDGEQLLREMQDIREELAQFNSTVDELIDRSKSVVPLKQRRQSLRQPTPATAICNYKKMDVSISKGDRVVVHDNSTRVKWRVHYHGRETLAPGVIFTLPPPNQEAIDAAEKLKRQYERCIALWQKKQLRLRQNMIFATIKVVKSWDLAQFIAMGPDQRNAIRRALNEDAEKLIQEGDPNDPQLRRLKREIDEVNRLFDEFERRANEPKPGEQLIEQSNSLKEYLDMMEKLLIQRCLAAIPRDLDLLEQLVIEHKQFENDLTSRELEVENIQKVYHSLSRRSPAVQRAVEAVTQQWDRIWALSHVYIERMKCVEMVVTGIDEGTQVVSDIEMKLAEYQDLPDDADMLEHTHKQLLQIQNIIQDHQILIDRLLEECRNVRTLVVKSRPSQKFHPDVDKLEEDVRKLSMRWDTICTQIIERVRSCEIASELLAKYQRGHEVEQMVTNSFQSELRSEKIEDLGPSEAELEAERLRKMYMKVIEKLPDIENVNVLGSRFIREAKIYDQRLSTYKESLEELHPSLDASLNKRQKTASGADSVAKEVDNLNKAFCFVADEIYDRLAKICKEFRHSNKFKFDMSDLQPLSVEKTYKTELGLTQIDFEDATVDVADKSGNVCISKSSILISDSRGTNGNSTAQLYSNGAHNGASLLIEDDILLKKGQIIHPLTGKPLSIGEAVAAGLLSLVLGTYRDPVSKQEVSLDEAVDAGFLSADIVSQLRSPCGVVDPTTGRELALVDAAKLGLYDPDKAMFVDPGSGKKVSPDEAFKLGLIVKDKVSHLRTLVVEPESLSLYDAILSGIVDTRTGSVTIKSSNEVISLTEAFDCGLIYIPDSCIFTRRKCLADTISLGLIDFNNGHVKDSVSGSVMTLDAAITAGVIADSVPEIANLEAQNRVSVKEAISTGILDSFNGTYFNVKVNQSIPLQDAFSKSLIVRPCSIKDCCDGKLLDEDGRFTEPLSGKMDIYLLDAVGKGILDTEYETIKNTKLDCFTSLPRALMNSVILPEGKYCDICNGEVMSLTQAVKRGFIKPLRNKNILNIECIKDPQREIYLSLKEAISKGIISDKSGKYCDVSNGEEINLEEAVKRELILAPVCEQLLMKTGMKGDNGEKTVLEAILNKDIDLDTGNVVDPITSQLIPISSAVSNSLLTPEGAAHLTSLLNIIPADLTITKSINKAKPNTDLPTLLTLADAQKMNFINEELRTFVDPKTHQTFSIEEAVKLGLIDVSKEALDQDLKPSLKRAQSPSKLTSLSKIIKSDFESDLRSIDPRITDHPPRITDHPMKELPTSHENDLVDTKNQPSDLANISYDDKTESQLPTSLTEPVSVTTKIPDEGWFLKEAIDQSLFDPSSGLFVIPGTDRLVSFQECINLGIINPHSAEVLDNSNKIITIIRALDKNILDTVGKYPKQGSSERMSMKEAIDKKIVILKPYSRNVKLPLQRKNSSKNLYITSVEGHPGQVQIKLSEEEDNGEGTQQLVYDVPTEELVHDLPSINKCFESDYCSEEDLITVDNTLLGVISAVDEGKVDPNIIRVKDPNSDKVMNIKEALDMGVIDKNTGEYKDNKGRKFSLANAAKMGAIGMAAIVGAPVIAGIAAAQTIKKGMKDKKAKFSSDQRENIDFTKEGTERTDPHAAGLSMRPDLVKKELETIQPHIQTEDEIEIHYEEIEPSLGGGFKIEATISTSTEFIVPNTQSLSDNLANLTERIALLPKSLNDLKLEKVRRKSLEPSVGLEFGIIDERVFSVIESFLNCNKNKPVEKVSSLTEFIRLQGNCDFGKINNIVTGEVCSFLEAIDNGILDNHSGNVIVPIGRSLTIPEIIKQGLIDVNDSNFLIVHPESGNKLNLMEAIYSDIVDPLSNVCLPGSQNISLIQAINGRIINVETGIVSFGNMSMSVVDSIYKRNIFIQPNFPRVSFLPSLGMTLPVMIQRFLLNTESQTLTHPITQKLIPVSQAIENGFLFPSTGPLSSHSIYVIEAMKRDLIDTEKSTFINPHSKNYMMVQDAIDLGLLQLFSIPAASESDAEVYTIKSNSPNTLDDEEIVVPVDGLSNKEGVHSYEDLPADKIDAPSKTKSEESSETDKSSDSDVTSETSVILQPNFASSELLAKDSIIDVPSLLQDHQKPDHSLNEPVEHLDQNKEPKFATSAAETEVTFNVKPGCKVISLTEIQCSDGKIINIEEAELHRLVTFPTDTSSVSIESNETDPDVREKVSEKKDFRQAFEDGLLDIESGTYRNPSTQTEASIQEAILSGDLVPMSIEKESKDKELNIIDAFTTLYDNEEGKFKDPISSELVTFEEAINKGIIDDNSLVYDSCQNKIMSAKEALDQGVLDPKSGEMCDKKTNSKIKIGDAVKMGLLAVVGAPILAGMAVKKYVGNKNKKLSLSEPINTCKEVGSEHIDISVSETSNKNRLSLTPSISSDLNIKTQYAVVEAIDGELIDPFSSVIKDPLTGKFKSVKLAIEEGIIDYDKPALFSPRIGGKSIGVLDHQILIYPREPFGFEQAIETGLLNVQNGKFTINETGELLPFAKAIYLGYIDVSSAFVKDTGEKKLCNLEQSLQREIIHPEKGYVIDTEGGRILTMQKAIENGVIIIPSAKISLFDVIEYELYDPGFKTIRHVFTGQQLAFKQSFDEGFVDEESAVVKCPSTGQISDILTALSSNLLNSVTGDIRNPETNGEAISLPEAKERGYLLLPQKRQAMIEKYKQCDATVADMLEGIGEVERRLAEQEPVSENHQQLRNQINTLKVIKETLDEMFRPLGTCLDIVRHVVDQGGDILSRGELESLDAAATQLKNRYDHCVEQADTTHRRLTTASEELTKYEKEIGLFQTWLKQAGKILVEKERLCSDLNKAKGFEQGCRDFLGDVIAHQADLRFITMACQKFYDESSDYLRRVNAFRSYLPDHYSMLQANPHSAIKDAVDDVTAEFKDLLSRANKLVDKVGGVGSKQREYTEALEKATKWMKEMEAKAHRVLQEPVAGDPKAIQDQLDKTKAINNELHANSRLFDNCRSAAAALIKSLEGELTAREQEAIERPPEELASRYADLTDRVGQRCQELDSALVQSQGVQEALDSLMSWLNNVELQLKNASKPASLIRERLDEQIREQRQMHADIMSHQASVVKINESAEGLMRNASNVRMAKKIETKLKELNSKYEKAIEKSDARGQHLEQVSIQLDAFSQSAEHFDEWYIEIIEVIESKEVLNLDTSSYQRKIDEIARQRDARAGDFDGMIHTGKDLVNKKDVTDTALVRDKIKNLENQWKDLNDTLDDRARAGMERSAQQNAYEQLRDKTLQWLNSTERTIDQFEPVALDQDILKRQYEELIPLLKDYQNYASTIDKLNELGAAYDSLVRGDRSTDSLGRRRSSATPVKRPSFSSPLKSSVRRVSQEARSTSPSSKLFGYNGTRRTSQDGYQDDMSPVQRELNEINNRYDMIGMRLNERNIDLDNMREELRKLSDNMKLIAQALEKVERNVPKHIIPNTKEEADKYTRLIKSLLDELSEKQPALDNLKTQIVDLIRKKPNALGADILMEQLDDLLERFKELQGHLKDKLNFMDKIKEFLDNHDTLNNWLNSKNKMMAVLGPIASDPRMAQMQAQQVMVLRDEFLSQEPKLNALNNLGDKIVSSCEPNSPAAKKINDKLDSINNKWSELLGHLDARDSALDAASDACKEFYDNYNKLYDKLQKLGDDFDEAMSSGLDPSQQLNVMQALENGLEGVRSPLINLEGLGDHLMSILSDPSSKSDIKSKIGQLNRMFNILERKLGNKKSELEASLKDQEEFGNACHDVQDWLADQIASLKDQLLISADKDILTRQVNDFEPVYKDLMGKEHEVIMMINKGKELIAKSPRKDVNKQLSITLDAIKKEWDNVKKTAVDRRTRLQKCFDVCNKFHNMQGKFMPWLEKAEQKAQNFENIAFNKKTIDKQIKDLQSFKNEVSRHSGEYENNKSGGEALIACTDTDHDVVKDMIDYMREQWDRLNHLVTNRGQELDDIAQKLADFFDKTRDANHALQRCEDKLASQDALGDNKDAKSLERVRALLEETKGLANQVDQAVRKGDDLINIAADLDADSTPIENEVHQLVGRFGDLKNKLEERCGDLEEASQAANQLSNMIKNIGNEIQGLDDELDRMGPVGRDIKTVRAQIEELRTYMKKIDAKTDEVEGTKVALNNMSGQGCTANKVAEDQIRQLSRQIKKIQDRGDARGKDLDTTLKKLEEFYAKFHDVMDDIERADKEGDHFKPVGADVDTIRAQQEEFKKFKAKKIEGLGKQVSDCNKKGQGLIQSASSGVDTSGLERDLEAMNNLWNKLKEMIVDREKRLDKGLMQSGKFQDALDSMSQWLSNFEEMMANQAPISAEYSVVKAQAQEQKFLRKMLLDRQGELKALLDMGRNLAANLNPSEKANVEGQLRDLVNRFDDANARSLERMELLEEALKMAKEFQNKLNPILVWLDRTDKKLKDMSVVPSDEDKIQRLIRDHDKLHDEILGQKPAFDDLTDCATALMSLIGDDEANTLADKLQSTTDRYGQLVEDSEALGKLLQQSKMALRHLVLTYEDLLSWMDEMDARLSKYRVLSVFVEKLLEQMDELTDLGEEVVAHENQVAEVMDAGTQLMKHISSDEAIQLKEKLDSIQRRYNDLSAKATDLHKAANEALPLVQQFHKAHEALGSWMLSVEGQLQSMDSSGQGLVEDDIERLGHEIQENRPLLEAVNLVGPQLCQLSPGEGAATIETLVTRDNRRFEQICEQIQRRLERVQMSKQRSNEVMQDIDELLDWFREVESQIKDAEPPSVEPDEIRIQLKEHKALNDDIASQKGRVRDVLANTKRVLREAPQHEDTSELREKMTDLKETMESVSKLSSDRLSILEQALPLAEHFFDTHHELDDWLTSMENEAMVMDVPALRVDQILRQMEKNKGFLQSIADHKPLLDKLNKTGAALLKLINDEDAAKIQDILDSDNGRYNSLKNGFRERGQALEDALQETSQFADKLDSMLSALSETADQVKNAEPISAYPDKIMDQMQDNNNIIKDLDRKESAFEAVKAAAEDVINKAPRNDPAVKDIKSKLDRLNKLWNTVIEATKHRGRSLDEALALAEKFWDELQHVMSALKELQDALKSQEPVAVEPNLIKRQRDELNEIKDRIDQTKPEVENVRKTGRDLMHICGEADKHDVNKNIDDMDYAWDNVTALFAKREENLIDAMEKAMEFHDTLRNMLEFLEKAENKFTDMGPIAGDIEAIKKQINQLQRFKDEVDPYMVKVESLNRQAQELKERTSPDQAAAIMRPLNEVNVRWDALLKGIVGRQRDLEYALLKLGQFQHALNELLVWIEKTDRTLDDLKPVFGDPQVIEVELAKLKVQINDIKAHQSSVDTLNDAGRQLIEADKGSEDASITQKKLKELNKKWTQLQDKAMSKQNELENALREAQIFNAEVQDLLLWLADIDQSLSSSKPVAGLPETAREQLLRFMELFDELEESRPKVEGTLQQGQEYLKRSRPGAATNLNHDLRTLKQRWESVLTKANDKKIKLEIALKEATEFHEALQTFVDWLTEAESILNNQHPVSRVLDIILQQIEDHNTFKKDVTSHREVMVNLEKKGTHLKYFTQKQDVILIKNLLVSVQHRWEKVVHKAADRTRQLDLGFKEAKEFHDAWNELMTWLDESESSLDELAKSVGNDPQKIKMQIAKHKEFQKALGAKQPFYDATMKMGKSLLSRAPKSDETTLKQMLSELKNKWNDVCQKSVDRQRKLEEALLFTGQFKDAIQALLDWLKKVELGLVEDGPVHGDLDTVLALVEQHKAFCAELKNRHAQVESVRRTASDLLVKASPEDAASIKAQISELVDSWDRVERATEKRTRALEEALQAAEKLHKVVHNLLDWLSDAEMKLRYAGQLPEDEEETLKQIEEHEAFMRELKVKEVEKDETIALAEEILAKAHPDGIATIKHWITIIQARWEEVTSWANQRAIRLDEHIKGLKSMLDLLDELMRWLIEAEKNLTVLEAEPLPDEIPAVKALIEDHKLFMDEMQTKEPDVLSICKPFKVRSSVSQQGKRKSRTSMGRESLEREASPTHDPYRKSSWINSLRESSPGAVIRRPSKPGASRPTSEEIHIKNPRARALWEKWQQVGFMAYERMRRLYDHLNYLQELEDLKNFQWEEWRKRFMKFMNNKKSRVTDLFRKMDTDNDGAVPRDEFIEGIIKTKFPTSRLEMGTVADIFDRNHDGYIDYQEFIAALRPDWEHKGPITDAEKIDDEVQRQVNLCTCRQKFRVHQVGEGKYRFGDQQKLCLVRILRSTVMVRVGGGWLALDEFLVKNDPCRAKGRTNVELREQFILAEGVSQSMTPFKAKRSPGNSASSQQRSQSLSTSGPIMKVRERTAKSQAMGRQSLSGRTPDSSYGEDSSGFRMHGGARRGFTPRSSESRGGSRPGSRSNSRPPSRAGSDVSLDSYDGSRKGSMRRTPSFTGSSKTPSSHGVQRSSSLRKGSEPVRTSIPTVNGSSSRIGSGYSRLYTPTLSSILKEKGVRNNLSGSVTNLELPPSTPLRSRTSSTTSLTSNHSGSRIPVLRPKLSTPNSSTSTKPSTPTSRSRTASGSSHTDLTAGLSRQRSGASDTPTGTSRKSGMVEPRRRI